MQPKIWPIIVNYNGDKDTIECLDSIQQQQGVICHPLVVDNGSEKSSISRIKAAHPNVEMLMMDKNLGFSGGNNVAIQYALESGCDYLFLVNNDTTMEPDCLQNLLDCAESNPSAAVVSPAIYYYSDPSSAWFTGSTMDLESGAVSHIIDDVRTLKIVSPYEVPWSNGCAMLVRADVMRSIGGFDDRFFCYWEDTDWSFRAKEQGYQCLLCPTAVLYHKVSSTIKKKNNHLDYYMTRNRLLFVSKHAPADSRRRYLRLQTKKIIRQAARSFYYHPRSTFKTGTIATLVGTLDFYRQRFGSCQHSWL